MTNRLTDLYAAPSLSAQNAERRVSWTELFFDLAFVVAISSTAHTLSSDTQPRGLLEFVVIFTFLQWSWFTYTFYCNWIDSDDLLHRVMALVQMAFVLSIAGLHDWLGEDYPIFVVCYCALRGITILAYLHVGWRLPQVRTITCRYAIGFSVTLLPLIFAVFVDDPDLRLAIASLTVLLQFLPPVYLVIQRSFAPLNTSHVVERTGLFVTLALGECLVAITHVGSQEHLSVQMFGVGMLALVPVFSFWWIYFARLDEAILDRGGLVSLVWLCGHIGLVMSVVAVAVGLGENMQLLLRPGTEERVRLLSRAWSSVLVFFVVIAAVRNWAKGKRAFDFTLVLCLIVASVVGIASVLAIGSTPKYNLLMVAASGLLLLTAELAFSPVQKAEESP